MLLLVLALCLLPSPAHAGRVLPSDNSSTPNATDAALKAVDWEAAGKETTGLLAELLRVQSINPPGSETPAVELLAAKLRAEGIESEIIEFAPGRGSLVARIPGNGSEKPLCLLSHVDVVPVESQRWSVDPFGGIEKDGFLWGRGALDMKGMTALETMTLIQFKRLGLPLRRDIILLAVADEEVDSGGIDAVIKQWDQIGCSHSINEGGYGLQDLFFEGQVVHAISVAEKGAVWMKMIATGAPGHGSTPVPGRAPEHLSKALAKLATRKDRPDWAPALLETFRRVGKQKGGISGSILQSPGLVKLLVKKRLMSNPPTHAALTDTVNVTGFFGGKQPNVVPSEVGAVLDCRILPGHTAEALVAELVALVDNPAIRFEITSTTNANGSPWEDPFFQAIAERAVEGQDNAVAGPVVSIGYTDSQALRPLGVNAYGYVPFVINGELLSTAHGDDERVPLSEIAPGLRRLMSAVLDVSLVQTGAPGTSPLPRSVR